MNLDRIKDLLEKIPATMILIAYLGWLGFDYYTFNSDAGSALNMKQGELKAAEEEVAKLKTRVRQTQEFLKSLDGKRLEMRRLAQDLEDTKAVLTDSLDVPQFMKQVLTEAQLVGLTVKSLKPGEVTKQEYYTQQVFELTFRGVFVQLLGFLDRLSSLQKIVRVDTFSIKPVSKSSARIIELEGAVQLKAYRYAGSKADEVFKKGGSPSAPAPAAPSTPASAANPGGA